MTRLMEDTPEEIERRWLEGLRQRTPESRFRRVGELMEMHQQCAETETRRRHPDATEREIKLRVASRRIPADLMRRAFGWDPDTEGY
jgi:hypothetical protein